MSKVGAELGQMQQLKRTLDQNAARTAELLSSVRNQLGATYWEGPAAQRFRDSWNTDFEPTLKNLEQALQEAGAEVQRRHDALQQAGS